MDKIVKGKLTLPPYLTPDARDLVKKVGSLLPWVQPVSFPRPCAGSGVPLGRGEPVQVPGGPTLWAQTLSSGLGSDAEQLLGPSPSSSVANRSLAMSWPLFHCNGGRGHRAG